MKDKKIKVFNLAKKSVYKSLMSLIDFSELMYIRLKYFKDNYRLLLARIFEEKDKSINMSYDSDWPKNKYVKFFLDLLLSLFAYELPLVDKLSTVSASKGFDEFYECVLAPINIKKNRTESFFLSLVVLFLVLTWYSFL